MFRCHVRTFLGIDTGSGRDGIALVRALEKLGMWVTVDPVAVAAPIPADIAAALTRAPEEPFDLVIHLVPADALGISENLNAYRSVAWTRWPYASLEAMTDYVRPRLHGYDIVVATDPTSALALSEVGDAPRVVPLGFDPDPWAVEAQRDWFSGPLQVAMAGTLTLRKDPERAIAAVQTLNAEGIPVQLNLKARGVEALESSEYVKVLSGNWSEAQMLQFYLENHVYLSTAWGSSKGASALEAGASGCALVVPDVGAYQTWAMPQFAHILPVEDEMVGLETAPRASETSVVDALASLALDREKARQMGAQASQIIPRVMSWERAVQMLLTDTGR